MKVIITHGIRKKEFKHGDIPPLDLECILKSYAKGVGISIKGESLPKGSRLIKLYATTVQGARRIVFLVLVDEDTGFLLFFRSKNDPVGKNITVKNPLFKKQLHQYIEIFYEDVAADRFDVYEVEKK